MHFSKISTMKVYVKNMAMMQVIVLYYNSQVRSIIFVRQITNIIFHQDSYSKAFEAKKNLKDDNFIFTRHSPYKPLPNRTLKTLSNNLFAAICRVDTEEMPPAIISMALISINCHRKRIGMTKLNF